LRQVAKSTIGGVLAAATIVSALPQEALSGPLSVATQETVGLSAPVDAVHYRRYGRRYYRGYRYDPSGAIFAGAALGLMGAGIAAASRPRYYGWGYGYPAYGYGWGYPGYYGWGW
jgi:hypothetical protein